MKQVSQRNILWTTLHNMSTALWWICVIIFVSSCLSSAESVIGMDIKTATFQMLHEHPKLKKCTETILQKYREKLGAFQKHEYVGCRVSVQTGQCEGLDHNWGLHPTFEQGYAYAKKLYVQQIFDPPLEPKLQEFFSIISETPVVLNTGGRIDISISFDKLPDPELGDEFFNLRLSAGSSEVPDEDTLKIRLSFLRGTQLELKEFIGLDLQRQELLTTEKLRSLDIIKISLLVQADSLAVLVGDEEIGTMKLVNHPRIMKWFYLSFCDWCLTQQLKIFVHRVEFTGK